jgi:hypothetical protein
MIERIVFLAAVLVLSFIGGFSGELLAIRFCGRNKNGEE